MNEINNWPQSQAICTSPMYPAMNNSEVAGILVRNLIDDMMSRGKYTGDALRKLQDLQMFFPTQKQIEDRHREAALKLWFEKYLPVLLLSKMNPSEAIKNPS